jgi:hypothetical protein
MKTTARPARGPSSAKCRTTSLARTKFIAAPPRR